MMAALAARAEQTAADSTGMALAEAAAAIRSRAITPTKLVQGLSCAHGHL
ncbi:MAG: hypothetical protein M3Y27_30405 [Acidobacteriota bacterium]|nr:hypothetical protein [Acidobacteriota bacterium]